MKNVVFFLVFLTALPFLQGCQLFAVSSQADKAKIQQATVTIASLKQNCQAYRLYYKASPKSWDQLIHTPDNRPLMDAVPLDPWEHEFVLINDSNTITISSNGPDGKPGTDDDISDSYSLGQN